MDKIKVGIMTFWGPTNYGAFLQAYALSNALNNEVGIEAELINFRMQKEVDNYLRLVHFEKNIPKVLFNIKRKKMFENCRELLTLSNGEVISDVIEDFIKYVHGKYDVIVAGSDEIWKIDGMRGFPTPYFLLGDLKCRKMSYAASGRTSFMTLDNISKKVISDAFDSYEYIGVRDYSTYSAVEELIGQNKLHYNLDPVFIFRYKPNKENGKFLLGKKFGVNPDERCVGVMFLEERPSKPVLVSYIKKKIGKKAQVIPLFEWVFGCRNVPELTPFEWIDIISALDGLVSMYFHGICFAILAGTPFWAIENRASCDSTSKIFDLLNRFGLLDYYSFSLEKTLYSERFEHFIVDCCDIDYNVDDIINEGNNEFNNFVSYIRG